MTEREPLLAAICQAEPPEAWDAMRIYADWLEERGDRQAVGWRLLAQLTRWPVRYHDGTYFWVHPETSIGPPVNTAISAQKLPRPVDTHLKRLDLAWHGSLSMCLHNAAAAFAEAYASGWRPE